MPKINERFLKISSRFPYPKDIELGEEINFWIEENHYTFVCVKTEDMDNQDSTINRIYTLKLLTQTTNG